MKVSIIVPIYNVGIYLKKCIESILNQTLAEIEVILVNDGSTDDSGLICDSYAQKDSRIRVIHKKNEGVSIARNVGIEAAQGEYIGFVDADDWIDVDMYSALYNLAEVNVADIVMCDARTVYDNRDCEPDTILQLESSMLLNKEDIFPSLLTELAGTAWRCIYKKELLKEYSIVFPIGLRFSEDRIFNIYAFGNMKKMYYTKKAYYNRYVREGSAVNKYYDNMIDIVLDGRNRIFKAVDDVWYGSKDYKKQYEKQISGLIYSAINSVFYKDSKLSGKDKYLAVKDICNREQVIKTIKASHKTDLRARAIINKNILLLCVIAMILNKKYGR